MNRCIALTLLAVSSMAATAWSQCNNPSSPGVVICIPTNGSTVVYTPEISIRSTPAQGASITEFRLYDNNLDVFDGSPGQTGIDLYDGGIYNGFHHFVVNAWDSEGHPYQAALPSPSLAWDSVFVPCRSLRELTSAFHRPAPSCR